MPDMVSIRPLEDREFEQVLSLLEKVKLPVEGLDPTKDRVLVAHRDGEVVGCVALEEYADGALLRSLAVLPSEQGRGTGIALTREVVEHSRARGTPAVYLLTETASEFFPRFGFSVITRTEVPGSVKQSVEFRSVCPETAVVMGMEL